MSQCRQIFIPNVAKDERIGGSFNSLFTIINETRNVEGDQVIWNFKNCRFLHPFFLAPLVIYKQRCGKNVICEDIPNDLIQYFNLVHFNAPKKISTRNEVEELHNKYQSKSYIPLCSVRICDKNLDDIQSVFQTLIERQSNADSKIRTPLSYFLSELFCNIEQHSRSETAYIFAQTLPKDGNINLCIADSGITIYKSFVQANKFLDQINGNEAEALKLAKDGHSTKDLPESQNRGYGISSTRNMLVDGLGGAFFMYSGRAFYRCDKIEKTIDETIVELPKEIKWEGTIILMKIPTKVDPDFNYQKYIY